MLLIMKPLYHFFDTGSSYLCFRNQTVVLAWTRRGPGLFSSLSCVGPFVHHLSCLLFVEKIVEQLGAIPNIRGGKVCHADIETVALDREEILYHCSSRNCEAGVQIT